MKTIVKNTIESITDYLNDLSNSDKVNIHNEYCQSCHYHDDEIFNNDDEFFEIYFTKPLDAVRASHYGDYRYPDEYVMFDGYANLQSFNNPDEYIDISGIAIDIFDHPENYNQIELEETEE